MIKLLTGLHHITGIASDAQKNLDFYAGILGLRFVKKTINFDAPDVYHLYYGDEQGTPGTIITFFPFSDITRGRKGKGQLTVTSFSISENAIDYWLNRLKKFQIIHEKPQKRFDDELVIYLEDFDGLSLELIANNKDKRTGYIKGVIPAEYAIKGFYGITLSEEAYDKTAELLVGQMDHSLIDQKDNRFRFGMSDKNNEFVDILCTPDSLRGLGGSGTIHHVAFATTDDDTQIAAREKLLAHGLNVTPVLDRQYFHSIYYREPGGVLFEIATAPPGFAIDEELDHLGEKIKLPPWEEHHRKLIEEVLPPIQLDIEKFK